MKPRRTHPVLYNEFDAYPAAWLRNLVRGGHIAPGVVDERSIEALTADDVRGRTQFHAFAGIGVWSYALRLAGWPDDEPVWTASCPCQPFSSAGEQRGFDDPRHLWPAFFRLAYECRPVAIFGEQVEGTAGRTWLDLVHADLEGAGYTVGAVVLPAAGVGAPHIRHRIFWCGLRLADTNEAGRGERSERDRWALRGAGGEAPLGHDAGGRSADGGGLADAGHAGLPDTEPADVRGARGWEEGRAVEQRDVPPTPWDAVEWLPCRDGKRRPTEPGLRPLVDRLAPGVAGVRTGSLKGYGNAIVGQVAAEFVKAYMDALLLMR